MELFSTSWNEEIENAPRIVLLHGMGGTGSLWRPIAVSLKNHYPCTAFDQRGHGESANVDHDGFSPDDYGKDVIESILKLNIAPCWLLGHSMGVRTACAAMNERSDLFLGMILVDLGLVGEAGGGIGGVLRKFLSHMPSQFPDRDTARKFLDENCPDPSITQYLMAVLQIKDGKCIFPFNKDALIKTVDQAFPIGEYVKKTAKLGKPILLFRGETSRVYTREEFQKDENTFSEFENVKLIEIKGTGHGLPFEKRKEFAKEVVEFIDNQN